MRSALLAVGLLSCGGNPYGYLSRSVEAYDAGREALVGGDGRAAAASFAAAAEQDPDSALLPAWQAHALSEAGDIAGALGVLDDALRRVPDDVTLRYNRAALRARQGALDAAAADLALLIEVGAVDPVEAGEDPDFAAFAADPALVALAPPPSVRVGLTGESGAVLLGEPFTREIVVDSLAGALISVTDMGEPTPLLRHVRTVEDILGGGGRRRVARTLTVTWRAVAAGESRVGPWLIAAGGASALTDAAPVHVVALPGRAEGAPRAAPAVFSPDAAFTGRTPPWAGRALGRVAVLYNGGDAVEVTGEAGERDADPVALELRADGQTRWLAELYDVSGPATVRVRRRGQTVLEAVVPPAED